MSKYDPPSDSVKRTRAWMLGVEKAQAAIVEPYVRAGDFFVNIGACDGISNDPIYPYIEKFALRGIAVEPVPHVFERLQKNLGGIPGIVLERVAIATQAGQRDIYHLPGEFDERFFFSQQIATFDADRIPWVLNELRKMQNVIDREIDAQVTSTRVECLTFNGLMERHEVARVDLLNIDVEGVDLEICRSIDLERWAPRVFWVESKTLDDSARSELMALLSRFGYQFLTPYGPFTEVFIRECSESERMDGSARTAAGSTKMHRAQRRPIRQVDAHRFVVSQADPLYRNLARMEAYFWGTSGFDGAALEALIPGAVRSWLNERLTGDGSRSWFDDVTDRPGVEKACLLGSAGGRLEVAWLAAGAERRLDVYDISQALLERTRATVSRSGFGERLRTFEIDLNVERIDSARYDLIIANDCLNSLLELEWVLDGLMHSLSPGGVLAFHELVCERRLQYGPRRLALMRRIVGAVPARYRWKSDLDFHSPPPHSLSPLQACRSDDVLEAVSRRFELVHLGSGCDALSGLLHVNLQLLERDTPELLQELLHVAQTVEGSVGPVLAYGVARAKQRHDGHTQASKS